MSLCDFYFNLENLWTLYSVSWVWSLWYLRYSDTGVARCQWGSLRLKVYRNQMWIRVSRFICTARAADDLLHVKNWKLNDICHPVGQRKENHIDAQRGYLVFQVGLTLNLNHLSKSDYDKPMCLCLKSLLKDLLLYHRLDLLLCVGADEHQTKPWISIDRSTSRLICLPPRDGFRILAWQTPSPPRRQAAETGSASPSRRSHRYECAGRADTSTRSSCGRRRLSVGSRPCRPPGPPGRSSNPSPSPGARSSRGTPSPGCCRAEEAI